MTELEANGLLDRALEGLPDRETLRARRATLLGLTRPELAVLLAYAKMHGARLLGSDTLCEDPYLERVLFAYFPPRLVERCRDVIRVHRLRRELIATTLTNGLVDLMGTTFLTRTVRESGATVPEVVRAFVVIEALTDAHTLAARAHESGPESEVRCLDVLTAAVERAVRWLLATYPSIGPLEPMVERFRDAFALAASTLPAAEAERRHARHARRPASGWKEPAPRSTSPTSPPPPPSPPPRLPPPTGAPARSSTSRGSAGSSTTLPARIPGNAARSKA
jgi:glutamate dehydrogenase